MEIGIRFVETQRSRKVRELEHLEGGLLVGKATAATRRGPEARVERLDRVGRVDDLGDLERGSRNGMNSVQALSPEPGHCRSRSPA